MIFCCRSTWNPWKQYEFNSFMMEVPDDDDKDDDLFLWYVWPTKGV